MFDGRESSPATGTTKIVFANYPTSLESDLAHQSVDATTGHAQGDGTHPTPDEQKQIVDFEMGCTPPKPRVRLLASSTRKAPPAAHALWSARRSSFRSDSSVHFLLQFEQPGGLFTPGDGKFTSAIFNTFSPWSDLPYNSPRAAIARGQAIRQFWLIGYS